MGPEDLTGEAFDVLLIDDICSFLTPRLVHGVKTSGRQVVGVYDPTEFADGKDRLLECGVADVVEADAHPDEFLRVIGRVAETIAPVVLTRDEGSLPTVIPEVHERRRQRIIAVGGPTGGVGATEVSIAIANRLAGAGRSVVLLDGDDHAPSVAQRLGIQLYPNIRTAIDVLEQRTAPVTTVVQSVASFGVVAGLPNITDWSEVRPAAVTDLAGELAAAFDHVVVNVGSQVEVLGFGEFGNRYGITRSLIDGADRVIAVGQSSPVGVARLLDWISNVDRVTNGRATDVLINHAPRDQFRRGELVEEITRTYQPASFGFLPQDDLVVKAAWDGSVVQSGKFRKAVDRWVDRFVPEMIS